MSGRLPGRSSGGIAAPDGSSEPNLDLHVAIAVVNAEGFRQVLLKIKILGPLKRNGGHFGILNPADLPMANLFPVRRPAHQVQGTPMVDQAVGVDVIGDRLRGPQ